MTDDLRGALGIFQDLAEQPSSLPEKEHLKILCRGHAAEARGWRLIAVGEGDEQEILEALKEVSIQLHGNVKQRRGPKKKFPSRADEIVLRRYFDRDPLDLTLRHFVEGAIDEAIFDRKVRVDVHVNRLQRYLDRNL
jgi:hypothetical protein